MSTEPETVSLEYSVQSSPHSGRYEYILIRGIDSDSLRYAAHHIMIDDPMDQSSRWSGAFQGTRQWLLLELKSPAILS